MDGTYNPSLVGLSVVVAMSAGYVALDMATRVADTVGVARRYWLIGGGTVMGLGIWAMHFIGMLAFELPIPVAYDAGLTALSAVFPITLSVFAIQLGSGQALTGRKLLVGGFVMGMGICAMHYTGMAAMRMQPAIRYEPSLLAASMLIAVGASWAALSFTFHLRNRSGKGSLIWRLGAAGAMGLAIAGMHYTSMAAARFSANAVCLVTSQWKIDSFLLAVAIAALVLLLIVATLAMSAFDSASAARVRTIMSRLRESNASLMREIAEKEQLTDQLRRSNRELEELAELASKNLQRPLHAMHGFIEVLDDRLAQSKDPDIRELLRRITGGASDMQALVNALVDLAQVTSVDVDREWLRLGKVVTDARVRLAATIGQRNARLNVGPLPTVLGDADLLAKMLMHLIDNAIKFQPAREPVVEIHSESTAEGCRLLIADRGIGIPEQHHHGVFEIFRRLNPQSYGGVGIGLSLVHRIVRLHGIEVSLQTREGGGLLVCLDWPAERVRRAAETDNPFDDRGTD